MVGLAKARPNKDCVPQICNYKRIKLYTAFMLFRFKPLDSFMTEFGTSLGKRLSQNYQTKVIGILARLENGLSKPSV